MMTSRRLMDLKIKPHPEPSLREFVASFGEGAREVIAWHRSHNLAQAFNDQAEYAFIACRMTLLRRGMSERAIAQIMGVSKSMVHRHVRKDDAPFRVPDIDVSRIEALAPYVDELRSGDLVDGQWVRDVARRSAVVNFPMYREFDRFTGVHVPSLNLDLVLDRNTFVEAKDVHAAMRRDAAESRGLRQTAQCIIEGDEHLDSLEERIAQFVQGFELWQQSQDVMIRLNEDHVVDQTILENWRDSFVIIETYYDGLDLSGDDAEMFAEAMGKLRIYRQNCEQMLRSYDLKNEVL